MLFQGGFSAVEQKRFTVPWPKETHAAKLDGESWRLKGISRLVQYPLSIQKVAQPCPHPLSGPLMSEYVRDSDDLSLIFDLEDLCYANRYLYWDVVWCRVDRTRWAQTLILRLFHRIRKSSSVSSDHPLYRYLN